MLQIGSVLIITLVCALCAADTSSLIRDLRGRGLDIGGGLSVHLDTVPAPRNASLFERHALRFDYNGIGLQLGVDNEDNAYKVGLFYDEGRGRGDKKVSEFLVPALLGYKTAALTVIMLFGASVFVLKTLMVAKMAIILAGALWARRLFGGDQHKSIPIEFDHHSSDLHPVYAEYPGDISELGYAQTADGNYVAFAAPYQDANEVAESSAEAAASSQQYSFAEAPQQAATHPHNPAALVGGGGGGGNGTSASRRRTMVMGKVSKPQAIHTYITVKKRGAFGRSNNS